MALHSIRVHKARNVLPDSDAPDVVININKTIDHDLPESFSAEVDAKRLADALWRALPGSTIDHLIIAMLRKRASTLHVSMAARR